jgi:hypothetical protein
VTGPPTPDPLPGPTVTGPPPPSDPLGLATEPPHPAKEIAVTRSRKDARFFMSLLMRNARPMKDTTRLEHIATGLATQSRGGAGPSPEASAC